jgi:hypothetical protein
MILRCPSSVACHICGYRAHGTGKVANRPCCGLPGGYRVKPCNGESRKNAKLSNGQHSKHAKLSSNRQSAKHVKPSANWNGKSTNGWMNGSAAVVVVRGVRQPACRGDHGAEELRRALPGPHATRWQERRRIVVNALLMGCPSGDRAPCARGKGRRGHLPGGVGGRGER